MIRIAFLTALCASLLACSDFQERLEGYPKNDTVINLETATSNEIADALSQLSRIAVVGDDWEFFDANDMCTVHVIDKSAGQSIPLNLNGAKFALHRDVGKLKYYAIMKHGEQPVLDAHQAPLRLFETDTYHDVFFAEGYLQALAKKCQKSIMQRTASTHH